MSAGGAAGNRGDRNTFNRETGKQYNVDRKNPGGYNFGREGENAGGKQADIQYQATKPKPVVKPKTVVPPKVIAPTTVELSQSESTDADADEYDSRKTKKKGRSMTILTSLKGLDDKYTLGKPSLLGS